jgi:DNA-directed RNA polymerase I subunit RPA43
MSIEVSAQLEEDTMDSSQVPSKSHKKHKSAPEKEKKKRKREGEDGHRSKSKKHKTDNPASQASPAPEEGERPSPFHVQTSTLHLPLAPISQGAPLEGLCAEHISPLILRYFPPFGGVVLSYSNPRLSSDAFGNDGPSTLLQSVDEGAATWGWVTAEFLLFKPDRGVWLEGYINLQNSGHIGVVCWNLFNANIKRNSLPEDWKWVGVEDQTADGDDKYAEDGLGYFVDGEGKKIEGTVKFRVREIESSYDKETGFLSIEGTMLDDEAEERLLKDEIKSHTSSRETAGKRLGGARAPGATSLGVAAESDLMEVDAQPVKHRQKY